jgi:hypothetical protein
MGVKHQFLADKCLLALKLLLSRRQIEKLIGGILDEAV